MIGMSNVEQRRIISPRDNDGCNYCHNKSHWKADCRQLRYVLEMSGSRPTASYGRAMAAIETSGGADD